MCHSADTSVPPEVIEAFSSAAVTAFQELVQVEAYPISPHEGSNAFSGIPVVRATIRLVRTLPGSMSLVLADDTAANLSARYLPPGTALEEAMIDDVAGEFANVIAGQAKTALKGTPYHFHLSTPTTLRADSLSHLPETPSATLSVWLSSEIGPILVEAHLLPEQ